MTKKILLLELLMLLLSIHVTHGQQAINNFLVERGQVVWRKTFQTSLNHDQLFYKIKESGVFTNIEQVESNNLIGELRAVEPDYLGAGFTFLSYPAYLSDRFLNGFAVVEIKEGRYRVTLKKISLSKKSVDSLHITGSKEFIEDCAFKFDQKELSASFVRNGSKILDYTFTQLFDFNQSDSEEW